MPKWELDAAGGLVTLTFVQLYGMYRETAPKLIDVRNAPAGDYTVRQSLMDADILVGGLAVVIGVVTSFLTGSYIPACLMLAGFALISCYYHAVCQSDSPLGG